MYDELRGHGDELSAWVLPRKDNFLPESDIETQEAFAEIAEHVVNHSTYVEPHIGRFLAGADPWLIAKAKMMDATVVTHESKAGRGTKRVKVPNVCEHFDVPWFDTYELLDKLEAKFILLSPTIDPDVDL